jgi:hypothetical protein
MLLVLVTAYLAMDRSHAEEVGSGARAAAEVLRGDRALSPLTVLTWAVAALVIAWIWRRGRVVPRPH